MSSQLNFASAGVEGKEPFFEEPLLLQNYEKQKSSKTTFVINTQAL
jgi:hypothetical protein